MLQERAAERGVKLPGTVGSYLKDLKAKVLTDLHEKPGRLRDILGLVTPSLRSKRQGRTRSPTCCRLLDGQGRAGGHRGHGGKARHAGFVPNRVAAW